MEFQWYHVTVIMLQLSSHYIKCLCHFVIVRYVVSL